MPPIKHSLWEMDKFCWLMTPVPNKLMHSNVRYHPSASYSAFSGQCKNVDLLVHEVTSAENGPFYYCKVVLINTVVG